MRPAPEPLRRDTVRIPAPSFAERVPSGAETTRFTLGSVQLSGNRAIATEALQPLWAARLGKSISLAEAFGIAAAISAEYRGAGFVLSQAIVPAQDLPTDAPATLRIEVLEGYVERVTFSGFTSDMLAAHLADVTRERPLRLATLERALLLVNELAGISAQANLKAGSAPNSTELQLVAARDRASGSLLVHNRSNPAQGEVRLEAGAEVRGLFGDFDRHALRLVTSGDKRLNLLAYSAEAPVGADGLKLQWSASGSKSEPKTPIANIDTESRNASLGLSYPVQRSRRSNVGLRLAFNGYDNQAGDGTLTRDRIRALRLGLAADYADTIGGISLLDLEVSKGFDRFGASQAGDPRLNGAEPDFTKTTVYLARLQSLGGSWSLLLAATSQDSAQRLPAAEQLGLGGEIFLRGFDPSEVIGENGYAAKLELRVNAVLGPVSTTWYLFGDAGRVKRTLVNAPAASTSLASYGLGLRFSAPGGVKGYVEAAQPRKKDVASQGNRDARVFAGLGVDF